MCCGGGGGCCGWRCCRCPCCSNFSSSSSFLMGSFRFIPLMPCWYELKLFKFIPLQPVPPSSILEESSWRTIPLSCCSFMSIGLPPPPPCCTLNGTLPPPPHEEPRLGICEGGQTDCHCCSSIESRLSMPFDIGPCMFKALQSCARSIRASCPVRACAWPASHCWEPQESTALSGSRMALLNSLALCAYLQPGWLHCPVLMSALHGLVRKKSGITFRSCVPWAKMHDSPLLHVP
mmetsp:Transcript_79044/g.203602  ORF Transcript_79044/g.203602 Transcript_79044/m.203602 type:complete len:234 (+) Transcript_79044:608-1309(+)